ncbi:MAG TPA: hypothetical protein VFU90_03825 [Candidatus Tumulicola sp.]|nr:hypothetical protein [Candidatus Tumulicola sp.]
MKSIGSTIHGVTVAMGILGVCFVARDARADLHGMRLVLNFGGTQYTGAAQTVEESATAVNGAVQYRVNLHATASDGRKLLCAIAVPSHADAESYRTELLNEHTAVVTCACSHPVTRDGTGDTFVFLNTMTPSAGDSLSIESR